MACLGVAHAVAALEGRGCFICVSYDMDKRVARYKLAKQHAVIPPSGSSCWRIPKKKPTPEASQAAAPAPIAHSARVMETRPASLQVTPHKPVPSRAAASGRLAGYKGRDTGVITHASYSEAPSADAARSASVLGV